MFSSKIPNVNDSIVSAIAEKARQHNALNLTQASPQAQDSRHLQELACHYISQGENGYAPVAGLPALQESLANQLEKLYGCRYLPQEEIRITAGATQAIFTAITAFIKEEDEVIIFEPAFDCYAPAIKLNGGLPVYIELKAPDFRIDWDEVKKSISSRTRMIILNSPHNPSGAVLSESDMQKLTKLVSGSNILIISDEIYAHFVFDGKQHQSIARFPKLAERSIMVSSLSKTFNLPGWKVGFCASNAKLMSEFHKVHQFNSFSVNTPLQHALAAYIKDPDNYLKISSVYQEKRDYFASLLQGTKCKPLKAEGSCFELIDYSAISQEKDVDFVNLLIKKHGIAPVPVSAFYHQKHDYKLLRINFARPNDELERVAAVFQKLSQ